MREVSTSAILVLILAVVAISPILVSGENIVSEEETTYDYTENYGFVLYPERAIDGNVSDDNYTRIITSCPHYIDGSYCYNGENDESFVRVEYNIGFSKSITWANISFISKSGYLSYDDPWGLTMSITALHANGEAVIWQDNQTPGYINNSDWELNNTGPLEVRNNGTLGLVIFIEASPFEVIAKDVEIRLKEVTATEVLWGCRDSLANNYVGNATDDDGSCDFDLDDDGVNDADEIEGCTDPYANNFSANATENDGSCDYDLDNDGVLDADEIAGCTDNGANNYNPNATDFDDSCDYDLDDDGVLDTDDNCNLTDPDGWEDFDKDGIEDACDGPNGEWRFDSDNDGFNDDREEKCNTDPWDNTSKPTSPYCGDESSGLNDIYTACLVTKNMCTRTVLGLGWNVATWPVLLGFIFVFRKNVYKIVLSSVFNRKIGKISSAHQDTKEYIKQEFVVLKTKILSEMVATDNQQYERFTKKFEADLAKLSLELKEYIDQKHGDELFDDSVGDTVVMLKENVDENEVFIKKVVISKMHDQSEEE